MPIGKARAIDPRHASRRRHARAFVTMARMADATLGAEPEISGSNCDPKSNC
jgi:hypothetical protein